MKIIDRDMGWNAIKAELEKVKGAYVKCGILSDEATWAKSEGKQVNLADVATFNEYGTSRIPSRPFMRRTFDTKTSQINERLKESFDLIVQGKGKVARELNKLGAWYVGQIQGTIKGGGFTPNAPSTIANKNRAVVNKAKGTLRRARKASARGKELSEGQFQRVLRANETLANAGNATPLIDTGRMWQSIHHEVKSK
jgi:hypothetical protein